MEANEVPPMPEIGIVPLALIGIGALIVLIYWIISIVKAFQAKDTLWGILNLLIVPLCGIIWFFMRGQTTNGIIYLIGTILYAAGFAMAFGSIMDAIGGMEAITNPQ